MDIRGAELFVQRRRRMMSELVDVPTVRLNEEGGETVRRLR